ncbi:MAG: hypothetical protein LAP39_01910 [Acidobacteriia bacterium]|nr:hypothetical protein [Terriglobia bacterium]
MPDVATDLTTLGLDETKALFEQLQARLNAAKIAYLNNTLLDGQLVSYEHLAAIAKQVIRANYRLQEIQFGKVRLKLSVAKLIRRGR